VIKTLILILCLSGTAFAADSEWLPEIHAHGTRILRRYEMRPAGEYQLPGAKKFYAQRKEDNEPILIYATTLAAEASISPSGKRILIREAVMPGIYRLLLVDIEGASRLSEDVKRSMLRNMPAVGPFDLGWLCDLDASALNHFYGTHPSMQLVLEPKFLGYSPSEDKVLITFETGVLLGSPMEAAKYKKSFKRRYYVSNHHGEMLKEFKGNSLPQHWWR
jgi:hypothetical protein